MRLLVNATSILSQELTGIERFSLRMAQELCRLEKNIEVISAGNVAGLDSVRIPRALAVGSRLFGRREYLWRAVWDQTSFRSYVRRVKPDVVFFPIQDGMLFPPAKQIVTVHDLHYQHFGRTIPDCKNEISTFRRSLYQIKMPYILQKSAAIVAVSATTKNELITYFDVSPEKIHVIYNGYDDARFRHIGNPQPVLNHYGLRQGRYFLFVGSILRHKNLARLIEAFAQLKDKSHLVIVGSCKDFGYCKEIMANIENFEAGKDRIFYLEYVPDDKLPSLYSGACAFVLPSLHEGFGVPIVEAMACGTPVITSNCSAMPEVAGDAAILVDPYSVESIAAAMSEIRCNPQRAEILRKAGLERCKSFTWSHSARKLYDVCTMVSRL